MAGICITSAVRRGGPTCDHRDLPVNLDGEVFVMDTGEAALAAMPWGEVQKRQYILDSLKRKHVLGQLALDDAAGCVCIGEEATNVKQYAILTRDVTKTNIGTAYVNISPGLNGERSLVEFTGCTQYRLVLNMLTVGIGPWGVRLVRDSDSAVLHEAANITGAGEKELDTDWLPLPAAASGLALVRLQGKSVTAADDPTFRRAVLLVR